MSGGWNPAVHLHSQAGGGILWDQARYCFVPGATPAGACVSRGRATVPFPWMPVCRRETRQDWMPRAHAGLRRRRFPLRRSIRDLTGEARSLQPLWRVPLPQSPHRYPKQFIDYQNDTTVADVRQAVSEGFQNVEHVKRYTALGFGTDQGKLGTINGMAMLAECLDKPIADVGTTTFRPPYTAVTFGALCRRRRGYALRTGTQDRVARLARSGRRRI